MDKCKTWMHTHLEQMNSLSHSISMGNKIIPAFVTEVCVTAAEVQLCENTLMFWVSITSSIIEDTFIFILIENHPSWRMALATPHLCTFLLLGELTVGGWWEVFKANIRNFGCLRPSFPVLGEEKEADVGILNKKFSKLNCVLGIRNWVNCELCQFCLSFSLPLHSLSLLQYKQNRKK